MAARFLRAIGIIVFVLKANWIISSLDRPYRPMRQRDLAPSALDARVDIAATMLRLRALRPERARAQKWTDPSSAGRKIPANSTHRITIPNGIIKANGMFIFTINPNGIISSLDQAYIIIKPQ